MRSIQIFLLILIIIGLGLIFTQKIWVPKLVDKIISYEEGTSAPKPEPVGEFWGSIFGTVMQGPVCPVMRDPPDPDCADKPYKTTLAVTSPDGAKVVKTFTSDAEGKFYVEIPPGQYAIRS